MAISGIKTPVDQVTEGLIWEYFKTFSIGYTFEDIQLAFMMHASGELEKRIDHYNLLDVNFLSQVMDLYLKEKITASRRFHQLRLPEPPKESTPEELFNSLRDYIKKHGEFPQFWAWDKVYYFMDESLMIEETIEDKKHFFARVEAEMRQKFETEALQQDFLTRSKNQENLPDEVKRECRKRMVLKWLPKS